MSLYCARAADLTLYKQLGDDDGEDDALGDEDRDAPTPTVGPRSAAAPWQPLAFVVVTHFIDHNMVILQYVVVASWHESYKLSAEQLAVDQGPQAGSHQCPRTQLLLLSSLNYYLQPPWHWPAIARQVACWPSVGLSTPHACSIVRLARPRVTSSTKSWLRQSTPCALQVARYRSKTRSACPRAHRPRT